MTTDKAAADRIVDLVWAHALDKITKGSAPAVTREGLGDDIDLAVPQAGTVALLGRIPAFTKLLYNSGLESANRNAYLVLRRLGMPADFFWKYDYWDEDRMYETLDKVVTRIFTSLMSKQKIGELKLVSVDAGNGRFQISFKGCAECAGLHGSGSMCFYHAGTFAGILSAMLDRELDAYETQCTAAGADACTFVIGKRDDRAIFAPFDQWTSGFHERYDIARRISESIEEHEVRELGNYVDIGYYQAILASSYLANFDVVENACFETGEEIGASLTELVAARFPGGGIKSVREFYRSLRYADPIVTMDGTAIEVELADSPEMVGPLAGSSLVPFVSGELETLLSGVTGTKLHLESSRPSDGGGLVLRFAP
jgi:hypothetical protein